MHFLERFWMLGASLSACCSAAHVTQDRLISLSNEEYNGTTKVEFVTKALGQADFFKLDPAPNATTFDSWYFDAMNPLTNETIIFNFEVQFPTDSSNVSQSLYRVTLYGSFANGTAYSYEVEAENVNITENDENGTRVAYFGRNDFSWSGTSLLKPRPVYTVTVNSTEVGISGTLILQGSLAAPHYSCGIDAAGVEQQTVPGVGWANAIPDANATVSIHIHDTAISFEGYGYHDKTWVDRPFETSVQAAFWGHARVGPYAVVWWHSRTQDGLDISSEYLARWADGQILASRCVQNRENNTLGWGKGQIWPLVPGTPAPAGMIIRWDLGDEGVFAMNLTSTGYIFVDVPFWQAGRGAVIGGFEGQETFTDVTGLWTLNQLPQL
ncbi:hypothetical protein H4I95_06562 [Botrytis cinerea]